MRISILSVTLAVALGQVSFVLAEYDYTPPPASRHQGYSSSGRDVVARLPNFGTVEFRVSSRRSRERVVIRVDGERVKRVSRSGVVRLPPGEHVIELRLPGHRTHRERIRVRAGGTYRVRHRMQHRMEPLSTAAPRREPRPLAC